MTSLTNTHDGAASMLLWPTCRRPCTGEVECGARYRTPVQRPIATERSPAHNGREETPIEHGGSWPGFGGSHLHFVRCRTLRRPGARADVRFACARECATYRNIPELATDGVVGTPDPRIIGTGNLCTRWIWEVESPDETRGSMWSDSNGRFAPPGVLVRWSRDHGVKHGKSLTTRYTGDVRERPFDGGYERIRGHCPHVRGEDEVVDVQQGAVGR